MLPHKIHHAPWPDRAALNLLPVDEGVPVAEVAQRRGGRTERIRLLVRGAVPELLRTIGADFTYSELAERSGVSRRTPHRRWPGKSALIAEVLSDDYGVFSVERTDDPAADLLEFAPIPELLGPPDGSPGRRSRLGPPPDLGPPSASVPSESVRPPKRPQRSRRKFQLLLIHPAPTGTTCAIDPCGRGQEVLRFPSAASLPGAKPSGRN